MTTTDALARAALVEVTIELGPDDLTAIAADNERMRASLGIVAAPMTTTAAATLGVGPYSDEDMSDWWVPISAQPNRMKAAHEVRQCMDDDSVLRYVGVDEDATFDLVHDFPCEPDPDNGYEYPDCTVTARSWRFVSEERFR